MLLTVMLRGEYEVSSPVLTCYWVEYRLDVGEDRDAAIKQLCQEVKVKLGLTCEVRNHHWLHNPEVHIQGSGEGLPGQRRQLKDLLQSFQKPATP
jgi:hypothetical protein